MWGRRCYPPRPSQPPKFPHRAQARGTEAPKPQIEGFITATTAKVRRIVRMAPELPPGVKECSDAFEPSNCVRRQRWFENNNKTRGFVTVLNASRRKDMRIINSGRCRQCGGWFSDRISRFCSDSCRVRHWQAERRQHEKADWCEYCLGRMPDGAQPQARYCSSPCRQASYRERRAASEVPATSV